MQCITHIHASHGRLVACAIRVGDRSVNSPWAVALAGGYDSRAFIKVSARAFTCTPYDREMLTITDYVLTYAAYPILELLSMQSRGPACSSQSIAVAVHAIRSCPDSRLASCNHKCKYSWKHCPRWIICCLHMSHYCVCLAALESAAVVQVLLIRLMLTLQCVTADVLGWFDGH